MECLALEVAGDNIYVNSIAPGLMKTSFVDQVLENKDKVTQSYYDNLVKYEDYTFNDPVRLIEFLISKEANGITGKLISAKYDAWEKFSDHKKEIINNSDVYTIRRITGKQAGFDWDVV